jgi:hypothetical protein
MFYVSYGLSRSCTSVKCCRGLNIEYLQTDLYFSIRDCAAPGKILVTLFSETSPVIQTWFSATPAGQITQTSFCIIRKICMLTHILVNFFP